MLACANDRVGTVCTVQYKTSFVCEEREPSCVHLAFRLLLLLAHGGGTKFLNLNFVAVNCFLNTYPTRTEIPTFSHSQRIGSFGQYEVYSTVASDNKLRQDIENYQETFILSRSELSAIVL